MLILKILCTAGVGILASGTHAHANFFSMSTIRGLTSPPPTCKVLGTDIHGLYSIPDVQMQMVTSQCTSSTQDYVFLKNYFYKTSGLVRNLISTSSFKVDRTAVRAAVSTTPHIIAYWGNTDRPADWSYSQYDQNNSFISPSTLTYSAPPHPYWSYQYNGRDLNNTPNVNFLTQTPGCGTNYTDGLPVVSRWTNKAYSGYIQTYGLTAKGYNNCGDGKGSDNYVYMNGVQKYHNDLSQPGAQQAGINFLVPTKPGDVIDIVTKNVGDCRCNETLVAFQVWTVPVADNTSGPPTTNPIPINPSPTPVPGPYNPAPPSPPGSPVSPPGSPITPVGTN